jgi:hypothetical protein
VAAGLLIFAYIWLNQRRWPVSLTAKASASIGNVGILQDLRLTAADHGSDVGWLVDHGSVRQLTVSGSNAQVILPLPPSECRAAAIRLQAECTASGQLRASYPVTISWSSVQGFASTGAREVASASLDVTPVVTAGALRVDVTADARARPSLCFTSPQQAVKLTLVSGPRSFRYTFTGNEPVVSCYPPAAGLSVLAGPAGTGLPPAIEFDGIRGLLLHARAPAGILYGFAGQLELTPGPTTVPGNLTLLCSAKAPCPLTVEFDVGAESQSLIVSSNAATSVVTDGGQLVPSAWSQRTDILAPVFGFLFSILVIPPLGAVVQGLIEALKRWPAPRDRQTEKEN